MLERGGVIERVDVDRDLQHVSRFHSSDLPIAGRGLEPPPSRA